MDHHIVGYVDAAGAGHDRDDHRRYNLYIIIKHIFRAHKLLPIWANRLGEILAEMITCGHTLQLPIYNIYELPKSPRIDKHDYSVQ